MTRLILAFEPYGQLISKLPLHIFRWFAMAFTQRTSSIESLSLYHVALELENALLMMSALSIRLMMISPEYYYRLKPNAREQKDMPGLLFLLMLAIPSSQLNGIYWPSSMDNYKFGLWIAPMPSLRLRSN